MKISINKGLKIEYLGLTCGPGNFAYPRAVQTFNDNGRALYIIFVKRVSRLRRQNSDYMAIENMVSSDDENIFISRPPETVEASSQVHNTSRLFFNLTS